MILENQIPKISLSKLKKSEVICFKYKTKSVCCKFLDEAKKEMNNEILKIYARQMFTDLYWLFPENYKKYEDYKDAIIEFWDSIKKYNIKNKPVFKSKVNKNNIKIIYYKTAKPLRILYETNTSKAQGEDSK